MLTDLLATVAEGGKVLLEEEDYLLARISLDGREMLAEISRGSPGGISPGQWPSVEGVLLPDSEILPGGDDDARILLFSIPKGSSLFLEKLTRKDLLSECGALDFAGKLLTVLRRLHDNGFRVGYLGPENVLAEEDGRCLILGGARGIPDTPFSPPEAIGKRADDPRSDVYALGLFLFRLIAGSDDKEVQIDAWNGLSQGMMKLLEHMVEPEVDLRYANLTVLENKFTALAQRLEESRDRPVKADQVKRTAKKARPGWLVYLYIVIAALLLGAAYLILRGDDGDGTEAAQAAADTLAADSAAAVPESPPDSMNISPVLPPPADPVIWVSNGTGLPGRASEFRQGPASDFSNVYTCTGSSRGSSLVLVRRWNIDSGLDGQAELLQWARSFAFADTSLRIMPVDITLMLGADLTDDSLTPGIFTPPVSPAGTLFVDIANHGVGGTFGGAGAATWARSVMHGRSIQLQGEEWFVSVVDFRDGDRLNPELGIPEALDSTLMLYRGDIPVLTEAENGLRRAILQDTAVRSFACPPPDLWVLLGS